MSIGILSEPTLVLNKSWLPIRVCSVRRALTLVFKELACVIGENYAVYDFSAWLGLQVENGKPCIHTVSIRLPVPEVIVLRRCDRFVRPRVVFSRRNLYRRDRHTCQYCGERHSVDELSIDHVTPRSLGGSSNWTNCVVACVRCNSRKGNRRPEQVGMKTIRPPVEPPPQMALTYQLGNRKASWEHFVGPAAGDYAGLGSMVGG